MIPEAGPKLHRCSKGIGLQSLANNNTQAAAID